MTGSDLFSILTIIIFITCIILSIKGKLKLFDDKNMINIFGTIIFFFSSIGVLSIIIYFFANNWNKTILTI